MRLSLLWHTDFVLRLAIVPFFDITRAIPERSKEGGTRHGAVLELTARRYIRRLLDALTGPDESGNCVGWNGLDDCKECCGPRIYKREDLNGTTVFAPGGGQQLRYRDHYDVGEHDNFANLASEADVSHRERLNLSGLRLLLRRRNECKISAGMFGVGRAANVHKIENFQQSCTGDSAILACRHRPVWCRPSSATVQTTFATRSSSPATIPRRKVITRAITVCCTTKAGDTPDSREANRAHSMHQVPGLLAPRLHIYARVVRAYSTKQGPHCPGQASLQMRQGLARHLVRLDSTRHGSDDKTRTSHELLLAMRYSMPRQSSKDRAESDLKAALVVRKATVRLEIRSVLEQDCRSAEVKAADVRSRSPRCTCVLPESLIPRPCHTAVVVMVVRIESRFGGARA
ncbi:hypothetical protein MRB53_038691 [Persea americana]|nr:hypothetical protein MRB53_038691 [Persea americana]